MMPNVPSMRAIGAALAIFACPGLAESQGIPVRTFQSAADFAKAARLQRLTGGAEASAQPRVPPGIPGYYDPATKTFTVAALEGNAKQAFTPAVAPASSASPTKYSGTFNVKINVAGVDSKDSIFCTAYLFITYSKNNGQLNPFDFVAQGSANFAAGQGGSVPLQFSFETSNIHHISRVAVDCSDRSGNNDFQEQYQTTSDTVPNGTTSVTASLNL